MTDTQESVNRVLADWEGSYFSQGQKEAIAMEYGHEVLAAVLAIYEALIGLGAGAQGVDEALQRFGVAAGRDYPWLSEKARGKLVHALVMNWK